MAWHHIALRLAECSGHDRARAWTIEADASKQCHFDAQSYQLLICTDFVCMPALLWLPLSTSSEPLVLRRENHLRLAAPFAEQCFEVM